MRYAMAAGFPVYSNGGREMKKILENAVLDHEWVELIKEAKIIGKTIEDIRQFLADMQSTT